MHHSWLNVTELGEGCVLTQLCGAPTLVGPEAAVGADLPLLTPWPPPNDGVVLGSDVRPSQETRARIVRSDEVLEAVEPMLLNRAEGHSRADLAPLGAQGNDRRGSRDEQHEQPHDQYARAHRLV